MRGLCAASILLSLCLSGAALAQKAPSAGQGFGILRCSGFLTAADDADLTQVKEEFYAWADGYITGRNSEHIFAKQPFRDMSSKSTAVKESLLRLYCAEHPDDPFLMAAMSLMDALTEVAAPK